MAVKKAPNPFAKKGSAGNNKLKAILAQDAALDKKLGKNDPSMKMKRGGKC